MPMGWLNSHAVFVAMMDVLQAKWNKIASERQLKAYTAIRNKDTPANLVPAYGSKVIVDDVLLYAETENELLQYFRIVLEVLQHHSVTIKLNKCKFFLPTMDFVGVELNAMGNSPTDSKLEAFQNLPYPSMWTDL